MTKRKIEKLTLSRFANGYHATSLKTVHLCDLDVSQFADTTKEHSHDFYELVVVQSGAGVNYIGTQEMDIFAGSVYLLQPGEVHHYLIKEDMTLLTFMFDKTIFRQLKKDLKVFDNYQILFTPLGAKKNQLSLSASVITDLSVIMDSMALETRQQITGAELFLKAQLSILLVLILRNSQFDAPSHEGSKLSASITYMLYHYNQNISVKTLAKLAYMSENTFHRNFRKEYGRAPIQWLINLRIKKSLELLRHTDMTIAEIAFATGFCDGLYFSKQFRKIMKVSPGAYRKDTHCRQNIIKGLQCIQLTSDDRLLKSSDQSE